MWQLMKEREHLRSSMALNRVVCWPGDLNANGKKRDISSAKQMKI